MLDVNRKVDIKRYWAEVFSSLREAQEIAKSTNPEFSLSWSRIRQFLDDCFIETAQLYVIERWEKIVGITPKITDSLNERRNRILYMMQVTLPYTEGTLKHIYLSNIVGEGNYKVTVDPVNCTIEVLLNPGAQTQWDDIVQMLDTMLPANMVLTMGYMGTTNRFLENYTHDQLAEYNHDYIRDELMFTNQK